jgi:nucleoside-diphosphate-sugar epimerase
LIQKLPPFLQSDRFISSYLVKLLLLRGETNIRIVDVVAPPAVFANDKRVSFIKADITSVDSVRAALTAPFEGTGKPAEVIYLTAASIRFYERLEYCWKASHDVNVKGALNVVTVAQEIPNAMVIYTSTGDAVIPRPRLMRLGIDVPSGVNHKVVVHDEDPPLSPALVSQSNYSRSKIMGEEIVMKANGKGGLRAAIVRPA